jgi:exonuclease 1
MGITGLLPCLRSITHKVHVREYQGLTVGIDAYCWLHRGAYTCCTELALGKPTTK